MLTIDRVCEAITAERQAQLDAEARQDADAWCGATEALDDLLDDLCALLRQRTNRIDTGLAPAV